MKVYAFVCALLVSGNLFAQSPEKLERPRLVVGIVVDQMRQEYLYRFYDKYGNGGFKRLMNDGFMLTNGHYNYAQTVTGPGHASIYSGTTPAVHGIINNEWYEKSTKRSVNCVNDPNHKAVGSTVNSGTVSPWRMLTTTVTDELKLFTQKKSKVISVSIKDRGAVLPAGHMGDAAYWYDSQTGTFITSTYYMARLPEWVEKFNSRKLPDQYLSQEWKTTYPIEQYVESGPDDSPYESKFSGKEKQTFPFKLSELRRKNDNYDFLVFTPFSNDFLTEMAKAALDGEKLGQRGFTDFLCVSYSTPDILGHSVGPNSVELEDMYIRLDKNMEDIFKALDASIGAGNYTVFLSSDHGVADVAQSLVDNRVPAGYFNYANARANLNTFLKDYFPGKDLVEAINGGNIFFDQDAFQRDPRSSGVEFMVATELVVKYLLNLDGVANAYSESLIRQGQFNEEGLKGMVIRSYHAKRSGDVVMVLEPGWYGASKPQGTTHGSAYTYDTHVPILFYGFGVKKGSSARPYSITDIAPTLSVLLKIKFPNGCTGRPVEELFEN